MYNDIYHSFWMILSIHYHHLPHAQAANALGNPDLTQHLLHNNTNAPRVLQPRPKTMAGRPGSSQEFDDDDVSTAPSNSNGRGGKGGYKGRGGKTKSTQNSADEQKGEKPKKILVWSTAV